MSREIPFNKPYMCGKELHYISQAHFNSQLAGDGPFSKLCHEKIQEVIGCQRALLTHSCTGALEMMGILLNLQPGDEIIMPSFTFVSTANAFVLRGAVPVFVDVRKDTFNIDENLIESAITNKTKAIIVVHYAGIACEMTKIQAIAKKYNLVLLEDAAQAFGSLYNNQNLGTFGALSAFSFHETKNLISGEGGALIINDLSYIDRAEILRDKGTNRKQFLEGLVDKYTWQDIGSSFLPGELTAAFLWAQMEAGDFILNSRQKSWHYYHELLQSAESQGLLKRPGLPSHCIPNGHLYYVVLPNNINRNEIIEALKRVQINTVFHYIPLHSSPAGTKFCRQVGNFDNTNLAATHLLRLPLWMGIKKEEQERVCNALVRIIENSPS